MAGWSRDKVLWSFWTICVFLLQHTAGQRKKLVFTATDFMLFDSANLVYFEVLRPKNISYVFKVRPAKSFGGKFDFESRTVNLIAADPPDACFSVTNGPALHKSIALVDRGGCSFLSKVKTAETYGALAVFIADSEPNNVDTLLDMVHDGTQRDVHIPAGFMLGSDGFHIKRGIRESGLEGAFISIPLNVTNTPYLYTRQAPWSAW
ncbi:PREDICTED: protease-associated domain-containing protein 1-like [Acropora digitifera]|uniref:protease-associated domain-containing protein 1-like n=1 Tax=Acropora digitifera TaxID=70779 RepID=UPI00077AFDAC|nr:PREDICTED: protease-associated domain-containing protein 1-like [Acropora digitifera]